MSLFKALPLKAFRLAVKPFLGKGLGEYRLLTEIYDRLVATTIPGSTINVNSYKMYVSQERHISVDPITENLVLKGTWEPYTTDVFSKVLREGTTVIDIGANIGYFTLLAASRVGESGKVFAFEPEPQNYALLVKNINVNGFKNVQPFQKAVSRSTGKMALYLGTQSGTHSLFSVRETTTKSITVDLVSLDEFFKEKKCAIDVIKVDVQGAEMDVLMGMQTLIKDNYYLKIFTEFEPDLEHAGFSVKEYWNKLTEFGFRYIYLINEEGRKLEVADLQYAMEFCNTGQIASVNLLCSKNPVSI